MLSNLKHNLQQKKELLTTYTTSSDEIDMSIVQNIITTINDLQRRIYSLREQETETAVTHTINENSLVEEIDNTRTQTNTHTSNTSSHARTSTLETPLSVPIPTTFDLALPMSLPLNLPQSIVEEVNACKHKIPLRIRRSIYQHICLEIFCKRKTFYYTNLGRYLKSTLTEEIEGISSASVNQIIAGLKEYRDEHYKTKQPWKQIWEAEVKYKSLNYRRGIKQSVIDTNKSLRNIKKTSVVPSGQLIPRTETEVINNRRELKNHASITDEVMNNATIATLIEACHVPRYQQMIRSDSPASVRDLFTDYPILKNKTCLYYDWIVRRRIEKVKFCTYLDFKDRLIAMIKFLSYHVIISDDTKRESFTTGLRDYRINKARKSLSGNEEQIESAVDEQDLVLIINELADEEYGPDLLLKCVLEWWKDNVKSKNSIIISCSRLGVIETSNPYIAATSPVDNGICASYTVYVDKQIIMTSSHLHEAFIYYFIACQLCNVAMVSGIEYLISETILDTLKAPNTYPQYYSQLKNSLLEFYESNSQYQTLFPCNFYLFANHSNGRLISLPIEEIVSISQLPTVKLTKKKSKKIVKKKRNEGKKRKKIVISTQLSKKSKVDDTSSDSTSDESDYNPTSRSSKTNSHESASYKRVRSTTICSDCGGRIFDRFHCAVEDCEKLCCEECIYDCREPECDKLFCLEHITIVKRGRSKHSYCSNHYKSD